MARKRLSPPQDTYLAPLETKGLSSPFASRPPAPIAQIAGDSAVVAALREVTDELQAARAEGRLVQRLPLATIEADHLVRLQLFMGQQTGSAIADIRQDTLRHNSP